MYTCVCIIMYIYTHKGPSTPVINGKVCMDVVSSIVAWYSLFLSPVWVGSVSCTFTCLLCIEVPHLINCHHILTKGEGKLHETTSAPFSTWAQFPWPFTSPKPKSYRTTQQIIFLSLVTGLDKNEFAQKIFFKFIYFVRGKKPTSMLDSVSVYKTEDLNYFW